MPEGHEKGQDTSTGKFTPEQQQEVNRIVAREKDEAARKAEEKVRKEFDGVDAGWLGFMRRYQADNKEATKALCKHLGIQLAEEKPAAGRSGGTGDDGEFNEDDLTPTERRLMKMVEAQKKQIEDLSQDLRHSKSLVGHLYEDRASQTLREKCTKDGTLTNAEVDEGLKAARALQDRRPGLTLEEAFTVANEKLLMDGIGRRERSKLHEEYEIGPEDSEEQETGKSGSDSPPEKELPPVKLSGESKGGHSRKKEQDRIPEDLKPFVGPGGCFESPEDYHKWKPNDGGEDKK